LVRVLCKVEAEPLRRIPGEGPLIVVGNHINFLEVPVIYTHVLPRPVTGYAAAKSWKNPLFAFLFNQWDVISIRRGEPDLRALKAGIQQVNEGKILAISPEGTRSGHGMLQKAHPGVVIIAQKTGAPLLPVAHYGGEGFWQNLKRFRRTDFRIVVGNPFSLKEISATMKGDVRQRVVDEIMYQLAALLPPAYRGYYADLSKATEEYLSFTPPAQSNLTAVSQMS
jgi:1-acyl-sn-glycerol-3-phosphate acyltransferase